MLGFSSEIFGWDVCVRSFVWIRAWDLCARFVFWIFVGMICVLGLASGFRG